MVSTSTWERVNGLMLPKEKEPDVLSHPHGIPKEDRHRIRTFVCYYESDTEKFRELVESKGGIFEGIVHCAFLNIWNRMVGGQYCCVYQYKEELEMEVLC